MKYVELSHYVTDGLISYPGMPPVEISAFMTREECGAAMLDQIKMVNISGTYIDAPYHRFESGYKIGDIPLEKLVNLDTFVVSMDKEKGYFDLEDFLFLEDEELEAAKWLMKRKVSVVGIDSQLVDNFNEKDDPNYPGDVVHDEILGHESVICEDLMDLDLLPDKGARLYVIPIRVAMASFPARVFAILEDD